jgi:protein involved in polysaccharide export with SLBB domain
MMERLKPMRNRPFRLRPSGAARGSLGLFALLVSLLVARPAAAAPSLGGADIGGIPPGLGGVTLPATLPGDVPAFAGRVDPETYRVGPGDEFAFRTSDLSEPRTLRVSPTGEILLPDAGPLAVAGLTLREVDERAREALRPYVRGKGFVLTLQRPRRFLAVVVGDVARPGPVLVQAPVRASDAIEAAGGVTWQGARRGIVIRRGADSLTADLVLFERTGDSAVNPLVFETDVIVVPTSSRRVEIVGAVAHPGTYDLAPGDRASTLVTVAGGLLARAATTAMTLSREKAAGGREEFALPGDDPPLEPGDRILVPEIAHWREGARVVLSGEVALPGPYAIDDGVDRLGSVFQRAGGFTAWADSNAIRIERNIDAADRDTAFVRLAREQEGLIPASERDYVVALSRASSVLSVSALEWTKSGRSWESWRSIPLLDGDRVVVPRRALTVLVQGEVKAPGHVPFEEGRRLADYVEAAGGYTGRANKGRIRVTLAATGRSVTAGDVGALHAGDTVWVPSREPHSFWGIARDVLTTAAQVATIYLVVHQATK